MSARRVTVLAAVLLLAAGAAISCGQSDPTGTTTVPATSSGSVAPTRSTSEPVPTTTVPAEPVFHPVALPGELEQTGWDLVHVLPDGRWVVNSGRQLMLWDSATGAHTVILEAEFGIQAAANDRYVAYGVGGDEYLSVWLYRIADGVTERILKDDHGFLDLELTRSDQILVSRIRYTGVLADLDRWIRWDIPSATAVTIPSGERSYALYLLHQRYPELNTEWTYELNQVWHTAWTDAQERLVYAATRRVDRGSFAAEIYRAASGDNDALLYRQDGGPEPAVRLSAGHLIVNGTEAVALEDGTVVTLPDLPEETFPHGGAFVTREGDAWMLAALDRHGSWTGLFRWTP